MQRFLLPLLAIFIVAGCSQTQPPAAPLATVPPIAWQSWNDQLFAQAKKENKFVLLDLEAVWCHWCHVMDQTTYADADVRQLIGDKFIAVKVDQDSRPDLSNRYEDYGWPATVVFGPTGQEIVKRRGYLPPGDMASMLQAIIADPTPGPSISAESQIHPPAKGALSAELRDQLRQRLIEYYDPRFGSWGKGYKFLDADTIEYCLTQSTPFDEMAHQTLTANLLLIDPAWGGVYQYSTDGDWAHPHFEKIMSYQTDDLRSYARAWVKWNDPQYLAGAKAIQNFLRNFLTSPQGTFYTSQDADLIDGQHGGEYFAMSDSARRKLGVPRIDTHIYSRENGWAISAMTALYAATGDSQALASAKTAANWIIKNRSLGDSGFRHDVADPAGPYLGDTLSMGRAFLALYSVTADRAWLRRADSAADYIEKTFIPAPVGLPTSAQVGDPLAIRPQVDENIAAARFERLLYFYTGNAAHQKTAEAAMRYLASPEISDSRHWMMGGILLADHEMSVDPIHVTIVGSKSDPAAERLFAAAMRVPFNYLRLEWFDPAEGNLPNADVDYPELPNAAAFLCTGNACSPPMKDADLLTKKLMRQN